MRNGRTLLQRLIVVVLLATFTLVGWAGGKSEEEAEAAEEQVSVRFSWWGGQGRHEATLEALDLFMEENPGIDVEAEYGGWDGYRERLFTQLAGGTNPHLMQIDQPWLSDIWAQGQDLLVDLNDRPEVDVSRFDEQFLQNFATIDDTLLGLPTGVNAWTFIVNVDFFEQHGLDIQEEWDYQTLLDYGRRVNQANPDHYLLALVPAHMNSMFRHYMRQVSGGSVFNEDGSLAFEREQLVGFFELLRSLYENNVVPPRAEAELYVEGQDWELPVWAEGRAGMISDWISFMPSYIDFAEFNLDVARFAVADNAKVDAVEIRPVQVYSVKANASEAQISASAKLINFLLNDPEAALVQGTQRGIPASKTAAQALIEEGAVPKVTSRALELAERGSFPPASPYLTNAQIHDAYADAVQRVAFGQDAETVADDLIAQFRQLAGELDFD